MAFLSLLFDYNIIYIYSIFLFQHFCRVMYLLTVNETNIVFSLLRLKKSLHLYIVYVVYRTWSFEVGAIYQSYISKVSSFDCSSWASQTICLRDRKYFYLIFIIIGRNLGRASYLISLSLFMNQSLKSLNSYTFYLRGFSRLVIL